MSSKGLSIVGFSNDRDKHDFYPTPSPATRALLKREEFAGLNWECACGAGDISEVLIENGLETISTDLYDYGYDKACDGVDFLKCEGVSVNNIITNPPYRDALAFVLKSKECATDKIALFLKTVFLEGQSRYEMFQDKTFPLASVYQFSKRVTIHKGGIINEKNVGMLAFAWFVWDRNYKGNRPGIEWINDLK